MMEGYKKVFRNFQLACMGWVAITIAPLTLTVASFLYGYPVIASISESGTIANQSSFILPFLLGALALFALTYAVKYSFFSEFIWDRIFPACMAAGFTLVAMFPCSSPYVTVDRAGIIPVPPEASGTIHSIGALTGFGALIFWILICFKRSNKPERRWTAEKKTRNSVYTVIGYCMAGSLTIFVLDWMGLFGDRFPVVFVCEAVLLTFAGIACLIKSGAALSDKKEGWII